MKNVEIYEFLNTCHSHTKLTNEQWDKVCEQINMTLEELQESIKLYGVDPKYNPLFILENIGLDKLYENKIKAGKIPNGSKLEVIKLINGSLGLVTWNNKNSDVEWNLNRRNVGDIITKLTPICGHEDIMCCETSDGVKTLYHVNEVKLIKDKQNAKIYKKLKKTFDRKYKQSLYKTIISKIWKIFMYMDIDKDMEEIQKIVDDTNKAIADSKPSVPSTPIPVTTTK